MGSEARWRVAVPVASVVPPACWSWWHVVALTGVLVVVPPLLVWPAPAAWLPVAFVVAQVAVVAVAVVVLGGDRRRRWWVARQLRLVPVGWVSSWWRAVVLVVFGGVSMVASSVALAQARGVPPGDVLVRTATDGSGVALVVAVVVASVVVAPLVEELVFRGVWWERLDRAGVPLPVVLAVTSVVFAVAHVAHLGDVAAVGSLFTIGLVCGWLRWRTGRLTVPVALHALHNAALLTVTFAA